MIRDRNGRPPSLCPLLSLTPPYVPYVPFSVPVESGGRELAFFKWGSSATTMLYPKLSSDHLVGGCCGPGWSAVGYGVWAVS